MVGLTSPRSICPSMLFETPVSCAAASRLSFRSSRSRLRLQETVSFTSMASSQSELDNMLHIIYNIMYIISCTKR